MTTSDKSALENIKETWRESETELKILWTLIFFMSSIVGIALIVASRGIVFLILGILWGSMKLMDWFSKEEPNGNV